MGLMAAGAGLLPLMAGWSAHAALTKMPTDGADTLLMLFRFALVLLMTLGLASWPNSRPCFSPMASLPLARH
jgi:hypothetical protein